MTWAATHVHAVSQLPMTAEQMIDSSEQIFVAVCEGKESRFHDGNIYTTYKLRPSDIWKGKLAADSDGIIEIEELGGSAKGQVLASQIPGAAPDAHGPDIGVSQFVGGSANIIVGEEVLLFTKTGKLSDELQRMGKTSPFKAGNLVIVGRALGRFSVLTDPASGMKYITRIGVESRGFVPSDAAVRGYLNVQQRQLTKMKVNSASAGGKSPSEANDSSASGPQNSAGISNAEVLSRLGAGDDAVTAAIQQGTARNAAAREKSGDAIGALTGEIRDFDALSKLKQRVEDRVKEQAGK